MRSETEKESRLFVNMLILVMSLSAWPTHVLAFGKIVEAPLSFTLNLGKDELKNASMPRIIASLRNRGVRTGWETFWDGEPNISLTLVDEIITVPQLLDKVKAQNGYAYKHSKGVMNLMSPAILTLKNNYPLELPVQKISLINVTLDEAFDAIRNAANISTMVYLINPIRELERIPLFSLPGGITVREAFNEIMLQFGVDSWGTMFSDLGNGPRGWKYGTVTFTLPPK